MKGYSLHIGVNKVDENHYPGLPELGAAVNDAEFWQQYAAESGYRSALLVDDQATTGAVTGQLEEYAALMQPGDILLLTYSGHGGQIPNKKNDDVDLEKMDQTWCLYNEQLLDDELYECFAKFEEGTRILVVSDSCHSGTITKDLDLTAMLTGGLEALHAGKKSRKLPESVLDMVMALSSEVYEKKTAKV
ncbi:MAG: caspase family protein [Leadbetterella sp.]|nr:caspase family protein [Leadbetterella sp.]